jgi:hypothetical protein
MAQESCGSSVNQELKESCIDENYDNEEAEKEFAEWDRLMRSCLLDGNKDRPHLVPNLTPVLDLYFGSLARRSNLAMCRLPRTLWDYFDFHAEQSTERR